MNESIPEKFMQLIINFLRGKKTGTIVLNIKDGNILVIDFKESVRL